MYSDVSLVPVVQTAVILIIQIDIMSAKASSIPYSEISVILVEAPFQTKKGIYGYLKKFH